MQNLENELQNEASIIEGDIQTQFDALTREQHESTQAIENEIEGLKGYDQVLENLLN